MKIQMDAEILAGVLTENEEHRLRMFLTLPGNEKVTLTSAPMDKQTAMRLATAVNAK